MMLEACAAPPAAGRLSACGPKALLLKACATGGVRAAVSYLQHSVITTRSCQQAP